MARAVLASVAHHVTQRGVDRGQVFFTDADYETYLGLVCRSAARFGGELFGYCLMPNHVHWIVAPREAHSLARTFGDAHGRYASYANAKFGRSGHLWQNRFFSCALDRKHLWAALRYVERNPVRARMVDQASSFRWSSARAHLGCSQAPSWLEAEPMASTFTPAQWAVYLESESLGEAELELRRSTYTGRPVGSQEFIDWAEASLGRTLGAQKGGRPRTASAGLGQQGELFE